MKYERRFIIRGNRDSCSNGGRNGLCQLRGFSNVTYPEKTKERWEMQFDVQKNYFIVKEDIELYSRYIAYAYTRLL